MWWWFWYRIPCLIVTRNRYIICMLSWIQLQFTAHEKKIKQIVIFRHCLEIQFQTVRTLCAFIYLLFFSFWIFVGVFFFRYLGVAFVRFTFIASLDRRDAAHISLQYYTHTTKKHKYAHAVDWICVGFEESHIDCHKWSFVTWSSSHFRRTDIIACDCVHAMSAHFWTGHHLLFGNWHKEWMVFCSFLILLFFFFWLASSFRLGSEISTHIFRFCSHFDHIHNGSAIDSVLWCQWHHSCDVCGMKKTTKHITSLL